MQRVLVMGPPGSGKSTLAKRLGAARKLPVFHLDQAYWRSGWTPAPRAEFCAEIARITALPAWVIDGNFISVPETVSPRMQAAETIIYLDVARWLSIGRVLRRIAIGYGRVRADMPAGCPEQFDREFLRFVWNWNRTRRPDSLALIETFAGQKIILRGRGAARRWLARMCHDRII